MEPTAMSLVEDCNHPFAKKPEVLAPVGHWEALEAVIASGADAVYLGGKKLNMRMKKSGFNFSDTDLRAARAYTRDKKVKMHVTLNNLYVQEDLPELTDYLVFLEEIAVDALIVQDLAVVALARQLGLTRPLHASIQGNIHNQPAVRYMQNLGFQRVIISKDLNLEEITRIRQETGMELECFVHGDLCISHTGQCLTSALIFGESSNQGRCMKPCRWPYQVVDLPKSEPFHSTPPGAYVLAYKDLCLYPYLPQLIQAGVQSFKIEGRMRSAEFLAPLVRAYREAIDRYWADPATYQMDLQTWSDLYRNRVRDFTSGAVFGTPGAGSIGFSGLREPKFPTRAIPIKRISDPQLPLQELRQTSNQPVQPAKSTGIQQEKIKPRLAVQVHSLPAAQAAIAAGADVLYLGGEGPEATSPLMDREFVLRATQEIHALGAKIVILTPRITRDIELDALAPWVRELEIIGVDGLMVGNWGTAYLAMEETNLPLYGDVYLNLCNTQSLQIVVQNGICQNTASLELSRENLAEFLQNTSLPVEIFAHGYIENMVIEMDMFPALIGQKPDSRITEQQNVEFALQDTEGQQYRIWRDSVGRSHMQYPYPLCSLPLLPWLLQFKPSSLRLELNENSPDEVSKIVGIYQSHLDQAIGQPERYQVSPTDWAYLQKLSPLGYSLGGLTF